MIRAIVPTPVEHIWDREYLTTNTEEIRKFLRWDDTNELLWDGEYRDCDDVAIILLGRIREWTPGLAIGLLIKPEHMKLFMIDVHYDVWEIEPRNDAMFLMGEDTLEYFMRSSDVPIR